MMTCREKTAGRASIRTILGTLTLVALAGLPSRTVLAQISYGGGPETYHSVAPAFVAVDFRFDGGNLPESSFEFIEPAWGVVYTRPGLAFSAARGVQRSPDEDDLKLIDALLMGYGAFRPFRSDSRSLEVLIPVGLSSGYRKVSRDSEDAVIQAFEFTTLSIGAGLGLSHSTEHTTLLVRTMPFYGLATRSIGNDTGSTATFDADVELGVGPFADRFGITLGYGFRWQRWNLNASALFEGISNESFDYSGTMHTFRLGLLF